MYFALVFGAGFMLGPMRILCIAPRLGERTAELLEAPVMLAISILTARWVVRRLRFRVQPGFDLVCTRPRRRVSTRKILAYRYAALGLFRGHASSGGTKVKAPGITGL